MTQVNRVLLGKPRQIKLAFTCLIAGGHLLLEDVPGVGKTTLAHALAATFALDFQRVQFTSDLLPSDIIGVSVYERESGGEILEFESLVQFVPNDTPALETGEAFCDRFIIQFLSCHTFSLLCRLRYNLSFTS